MQGCIAKDRVGSRPTAIAIPTKKGNMSSQAWKNAERSVAKILDGTRRVRINYSESCEDVHHTKYAIEVKYGAQIPLWVRKVKEPILVNDLMVLFPLSSPHSFASRSFSEAKSINKKIKFIIDGMIQASSYNPTKIPLLCLKGPRQIGIVGCMYVMDYLGSEFHLGSSPETAV
jgi:hypothetical protein